MLMLKLMPNRFKRSGYLNWVRSCVVVVVVVVFSPELFVPVVLN